MIMLILATILLALSFALTKYFQKDGNDTNKERMLFNSVVGLFSGIIFLVVSGFKIEITSFSLIMAAAFVFVVVTYRMIGFKIMEGETIALYTVFLMAGGMMLPYIWGVLFLDEEISVLRTIGLVLIAISMVITNKCGSKINLKTTLMCIAVFILNGATSIVSKEHQIKAEAVSAIDFIVISNLLMAICCFFIAMLYGRKETKKSTQTLSPKCIIVLLLVAATSGASYFLQLKGAENTPATVLYPVITGGTVIFTAISGWVFFKEKITKTLAIGLALCFIGTCLFL